ncbi:DUF6191 domain-containing protein [Kitasatospora viridis]|uniref:Uncharacterized protein n=1 Tax=Kitasatospora viridis TaxID=281105 RepID=A0A561UG49_9ACTN|nr:DUF6191 domain-containing protein [Kitasatospora viridis]TWF98339.1 hypothetical protein FHX73_112147 [Kitasatospora viridis]
MPWYLWAVIAAPPALLLADRLLLLLERHGWVYWRKRQPEAGGGSVYSAINELQTLLSPAQRHVTEQKERQLVLRDDESAGAPHPGRIDLDSGRVVVRQPPAD